MFFNNRNDILAAQVVFESAMDLTLIPAKGTADKIRITLSDRKQIKDHGEIGRYLWKLYMRRWGIPKSVYDVAAIAFFTVPEHCTVQTVPRPALVMDGTYDHSNAKVNMNVVTDVKPDHIRQDFLKALSRMDN
jgi:inosine-uridine nucleoside N-ribohydrolase